MEIARECIKEAIANLIYNKRRSIMTMLGVIVGVFSVIFIQSIGNTIAASLIKMEANDTGNIMVSTAVISKNNFHRLEEALPIEEVILEKYQKLFNGKLKRIIEEEYGNAGLINENKVDTKVKLVGVSSGLFETAQVDIINGRGVKEKDEVHKSPVIVISEKTAKDCFGNENPIGQKLMLYLENGKVYDVIVIGVFESLILDLENNGLQELEEIYIPDVYMEDKYKHEESDKTFIQWMLSTDVSREGFLIKSQKFFEKHYENNDWRVKVEINTDENCINAIMSIFTMVVSVIAMISFFVGGVNIMNMLLISIGERKKEIGILKAIGASHGYIVFQFICESVILSVTGFIIGMSVAVVGSIATIKIMSIMMKEDFIIKQISLPFETMLIYFGVSVIIGLVFGVYPAYQAAKRNVVDALKMD